MAVLHEAASAAPAGQARDDLESARVDLLQPRLQPSRRRTPSKNQKTEVSSVVQLGIRTSALRELDDLAAGERGEDAVLDARTIVSHESGSAIRAPRGPVPQSDARLPNRGPPGHVKRNARGARPDLTRGWSGTAWTGA